MFGRESGEPFMTQTVKFKRVEGNDLPLPRYATQGAAGMDLRAFLPDGPVSLAPGEVRLISTGFHVELPPRTEMQIRPRSSLAIKRKIIIPNSPATIDEDYRGIVFVGLFQLANAIFQALDFQLVVAGDAGAVVARV